MEVDDEEICAVEETVVKKTKNKQVEENFLPLPDNVIADCSPELVNELQIANQLLQAIMRIPKIEPFLEKPNENLFRMSTYFKIIKKPMWLLEVQRKLLGREYDGIGSFVADVRLILENCYRYWGATHKISRRALYLEHKLEQRLSYLPQHLQDKCFDPELNANEVIVKIENAEDSYTVEQSDILKEPSAVIKVKGFESKILNKVLESEESEETIDISEEQAKLEGVMLEWEKDHLVNEVKKEEINCTWQLAEIGSFLKITWEAFNIEEITQYEVERMLLMPKESTTLANLMTSMLSSQIHRTHLDVKPVMPYEIWTSRLKKRIGSWYNTFYSTGDAIKTFSSCGIEPHFWSYVGPINPMEEKPFHELSFYKRVWILKSLCNNLTHIDKPIQDIFIDPSITNDIKPIKIFTSKRGISYFRIPFFREVRIYKQAKLPDKVFQEASDVESTIDNILNSTTLSSFNENENELEFIPNKEDFSLIADSVDSLKEHIELCKKQNKLSLVRNLSKHLRIVKKERRTIDGLTALYNQWHDYQNRSQEYFTNMLNLWLTFEKPPRAFMAVEDKVPPPEEILGKRRTKRNFDFSNLKSTDSEGSSEDNVSSDDVSDWENDYMKKNKKKTDQKKKSKQSISDSSSRSECSDISKHDDNSAIAIQEVSIKQELIDKKPDISNIHHLDTSEFDSTVDVKPEIVPFQLEPMVNSSSNNSVNLESTCLPNSLPPVPPGYMIVPISAVKSIPLNIKKEKDDVIYISSDEENESQKKSSFTEKPQLKVVKNGMPSNVSSSITTLPVRTPSPQQPPSVIKKRPVPAPIPVAPRVHQTIASPRVVSSQRVVTSTTPVKAPVPRPIPIPAPPARQYPLPIPEPAMPQPILEPPMPAPMGVRQNWNSPKNRLPSPRSRGGYSPRLRSPASPVVRTPSPRVSPSANIVSPIRPNKPPVKNLFPQVPTVEGVLEIGQKPDGSYGYHVRLPDGGIINMSRLEIDDIRRKNNGVLPVKIEVPLSKNKKF